MKPVERRAFFNLRIIRDPADVHEWRRLNWLLGLLTVEVFLL
jgi:hypothetical protein